MNMPAYKINLHIQFYNGLPKGQFYNGLPKGQPSKGCPTCEWWRWICGSYLQIFVHTQNTGPNGPLLQTFVHTQNMGPNGPLLQTFVHTQNMGPNGLLVESHSPIYSAGNTVRFEYGFVWLTNCHEQSYRTMIIVMVLWMLVICTETEPSPLFPQSSAQKWRGIFRRLWYMLYSRNATTNFFLPTTLNFDCHDSER